MTNFRILKLTAEYITHKTVLKFDDIRLTCIASQHIVIFMRSVVCWLYLSLIDRS